MEKADQLKLIEKESGMRVYSRYAPWRKVWRNVAIIVTVELAAAAVIGYWTYTLLTSIAAGRTW